ncbi:hypothetical protein E4U36_000845 [Claviceps purpurea]|nr:hypothetical protein E4U36_000845 [Claviceps purpurea]
MGGWLIFGHISLFWRARAQLDLRRRRAPPEDGTGAAARRVTPRLEQSKVTFRDRVDKPISGFSKKSIELGGRTMHRTHDRQYCSQKCFSGLVRGDFLDSTCPTVTLHCQDKAGESGYKLQIYNKRHPIFFDPTQLNIRTSTMDFNNSGDMLLYVQNLQRQAEEAQERERLLLLQNQEAQENLRQAQEAQERERRQAQELQERERLFLPQIEERD